MPRDEHVASSWMARHPQAWECAASVACLACASSLALRGGGSHSWDAVAHEMYAQIWLIKNKEYDTCRASSIVHLLQPFLDMIGARSRKTAQLLAGALLNQRSPDFLHRVWCTTIAGKTVSTSDHTNLSSYPIDYGDALHEGGGVLQRARRLDTGV